MYTVFHLITNLGSKFQVAFEKLTLPTIVPSNNMVPNTTLGPDILAGIEQKTCLPISSN